MVVTAACTVKSPYEFKVLNESDVNNPISVKLVMPLGGEMSGFYRSPKVDEKVLVAQVEVSKDAYDYYLMGYLPGGASDGEGEQPFFDMNTVYGIKEEVDENNNKTDVEITDTYNVIKREGQVFRYKKAGANSGRKNEYSEIGFYKKEDSRFPTEADKAAVPTKSDKSAVPTEADKSAPTIDEIDILSAGDIVIKAAKSITLEVGRSSITISDSGISMKNQLMRYIPNPADATMSMSARNGISIAAESVGINADYKWSISEKFGAIISGTAGSLGINGREICASSPSSIAQLTCNAVYLSDELAKITMGGLALTSNPNESKFKCAKIGKAVLAISANVFDIIGALFSVYTMSKGFQQYNEKTLYTLHEEAVMINKAKAAEAKKAYQGPALDDFSADGVLMSPSLMALGNDRTTYSTVTSLYGAIMSIATTAYGTLEGMFEFDDDQLDQLNYASMIISNSLTLIYTSIMLTGAYHLGSAKLHLAYDGEIIFKSASEKSIYAVTKTEGAAPVSMISKWTKYTAAAGAVVPKLGKIISAASDIYNEI
jgi:hypothetical protein